MKLIPILSVVLLFVFPCPAQEPVTLDLDTDEGLFIVAPGEYTQAAYTFGSLPIRDGEPAQGLTVTLNADDGLIFYGPPVDTGPGEVLVECTVWCTGPDVGLALVAMNLPDYSMMANLPASGSKFMDGWHTMRLFCDPEDDTIMPAFQMVSTGAGTTVVYVDQIVLTPFSSLSDAEILELHRVLEPTPLPRPTYAPTPTPTLTLTEVPTGSSDAIAIDLPGFPEGTKPLEMVLIPAGTFTMGSPPDERGRWADGEWLPHEVTITEAFYLGKYKVTQAQWEAVMGSNPAGSRSYGVGDDYPVYLVTWDDCQTYIENLNGMDLGTFRLPTEAEWEYACRAGTDTRFSFGDALECADEGDSYCAIMDEYMWWSGNNEYGGNVYGTKEVGLKLPNPWGLYDMHGNLWEWCSDWWEFPSPRRPQVDPQGPSTGTHRVGRGGGWVSYARLCRSAFRGSGSPARRYNGNGLRLLRSYP